MNRTEFDKFADEYRNLHSRNIRASGEQPDFFHEYKVRDAAMLAAGASLGTSLCIMDFGAGVGNSVPFFEKYFPTSRLTCVDVSTRSLEIAEKRFPGLAEYSVFDGRALPFRDESYDMVFSACVFHHISTKEHERLLREIHRVLRSGGLFMVFEHNPYNPLTVHAVNSCPFDENAVLIDANTLGKRVTTVGFASVQHRYRIFFPRILRPLRIIEPFLGWLPFGAQYYVVGSKALIS